MRTYIVTLLLAVLTAFLTVVLWGAIGHRLNGFIISLVLAGVLLVAAFALVTWKGRWAGYRGASLRGWWAMIFAALVMLIAPPLLNKDVVAEGLGEHGTWWLGSKAESAPAFLDNGVRGIAQLLGYGATAAEMNALVDEPEPDAEPATPAEPAVVAEGSGEVPAADPTIEDAPPTPAPAIPAANEPEAVPTPEEPVVEPPPEPVEPAVDPAAGQEVPPTPEEPAPEEPTTEAVVPAEPAEPLVEPTPVPEPTPIPEPTPVAEPTSAEEPTPPTPAEPAIPEAPEPAEPVAPTPVEIAVTIAAQPASTEPVATAPPVATPRAQVAPPSTNDAPLVPQVEAVVVGGSTLWPSASSPHPLAASLDSSSFQTLQAGICALTGVDRLRVAHDWIALNIAPVAASSQTATLPTAEQRAAWAAGAFTSREAGSAGFAALFAELTCDAGVTVAAGGTADFHRGNASAAYWNAVQLEGNWLIVDAHQAAGCAPAPDCTAPYSSAFFLAPPRATIRTRIPAQPSFGPYGGDVDITALLTGPALGAEFFAAGLALQSVSATGQFEVSLANPASHNVRVVLWDSSAAMSVTCRRSDAGGQTTFLCPPAGPAGGRARLLGQAADGWAWVELAAWQTH